MKTLLRCYWVITAALALSVATAEASDWVVSGTTGGYTTYQGDPYYWKGNDAYTRQLYTRPGYYSYGVYYAPSSYYQYTYSHTYQYPPAKAQTYPPPGWRNQLLNLAEKRDKYVAEAAARRQEQADYIEGIAALGMTGNFRFDNYGLPGLGLSSGYGYQSYKQQAASVGAYGNTQYGYSVREASEIYGDTNVNVLFQQADRQVNNAQSLAREAQGQFSNRLSEVTGAQARVAEILARQAAAVAVLKATEPQASAKYTKQEFRFGAAAERAVNPVVVQAPDPNQEAGPPPGAAAAPVAGRGRTALAALIETRCLACHGAKKPEGGLDLTKFFSLPAKTRAKIVARVTSDNPDKRMPLGAEGGPGTPLTEAEVALFLAE